MLLAALQTKRTKGRELGKRLENEGWRILVWLFTCWIVPMMFVQDWIPESEGWVCSTRLGVSLNSAHRLCFSHWWVLSDTGKPVNHKRLKGCTISGWIFVDEDPSRLDDDWGSPVNSVEIPKWFRQYKSISPPNPCQLLSSYAIVQGQQLHSYDLLWLF